MSTVHSLGSVSSYGARALRCYLSRRFEAYAAALPL
jgi:hypothetical protein